MTTYADLAPIVAGDDVSFPLRLRDENGDPITGIGDILYLTFKSDISLADEAAEMQVAYTIPDDELSLFGVIQVPVLGADTNIPAGTYHYDFQWSKTSTGAGERETVSLGKIKINKGVTLS